MKQFISAMLFVSVLTTNISAQTNGKIDGKIKDTQTNKPVDFASVVLYRLPDSTVVKGLYTDTSGYFIFNNLPYGKYYLKSSFLGYQTVSKDNIILEMGKSSYNTGIVGMSENAKTIEEVKITGERLKGTTEVDKTVYAVSERAALSANSGLELLRQVPSVQVDFQNNISLEGSGNILILVDGKTHDKEYLAQLDPKSIEKVEVMTNPSVKYGADVTGVINIVLKRGSRKGVSGRIEAEIPLTEKKFSNSSGNIEYGSGAMRFYASGYMHYESFKNADFSLYRRSKDQNNVTEFKQNGSGPLMVLFSGIDYGADWFLNDKNTISFYGNYRIGNINISTDYNKELLINGETTSFFNSATTDKQFNPSQYYSLFYRKTFSKPAQELTVDMNYYFYDGGENRFYTDQYYQDDELTPNGEAFSRKELNNNQRNSLSLKIDYTHPLGKNISASTGYRGYYQWFDNRFSNGDDAANTRFHYNENRQAIYGNFSGKIKDFNWQGGLRYEMSYIEIDRTTKTRYDCILPQASLQQKVSKTQSIKLNYRRSIDRPGISNLNPFINHIDSLTISYGNQNLKPAYTNKIELNYSMQLGNNFLSPGLYYSYFNNNFQNVTLIHDNGLSESFVENIGKGAEYGFTVSGSIKITDWWQFNPYFCVFAKDLKEIDKYGISGASKVSFRTSFSSNVTLVKKLMMFTYVQYNSPYITPQNTNKRFPIYVIGLEKELFKKSQGKITIMTIDPFAKNFIAQESITESNNLYQHQKMTIDITNLISIKFTYTFNKGQTIKKLDRQKSIESDGTKSVF